jgi:hypothetical protein
MPPSPTFDPAFVARFRALTKDERWGCVVWMGCRNRGYGRVQVAGRQMVAHRVAWMIHSGEEIPEGLVIDHLCYNKACVNPDHLEVVTDSENSYRILYPPEGWVIVRGTNRRVRVTEQHLFTKTGRRRKDAA